MTQEKNNAAGVEVIYFSPLVPGKKSCHLRPGAGDQSVAQQNSPNPTLAVMRTDAKTDRRRDANIARDALCLKFKAFSSLCRQGLVKFLSKLLKILKASSFY